MVSVRCLSFPRVGSSLCYHAHQLRQRGELIMSDHRNLIEIDPEKLGGTPVFCGTRVPVRNLFDCLEGGESLNEFLDQFPSVTREQALAVLAESKERLLISYESAA